MQIKTKIVSSHTADSKPIKQQVNRTVILLLLVFPAFAISFFLALDAHLSNLALSLGVISCHKILKDWKLLLSCLKLFLGGILIFFDEFSISFLEFKPFLSFTKNLFQISIPPNLFQKNQITFFPLFLFRRFVHNPVKHFTIVTIQVNMYDYIHLHPSLIGIDIKSLQNRLLKVCYVPATRASLPKVSFFFSFLFLLLRPLTVLMKQTR